MTNITDRRILNQHLLSYLKLRWANAHPRVNDPRTDFLAWLGPNGHTIDGPTTATLNGYNFLTATTVGPSLTQFSATNLPADGETVAAFLNRYQFAQLNATGGGNILDDAAHQSVLNNLVPVQSSAAIAAWNLWYPTDPANPGRTFPQLLSAFKTHLTTSGRILTGHAVVTLAAGFGFDFNGWINGQLSTLLGGPAGNAVTVPKVHEEAACWSWALTACAPMSVTPDDVITWLHSPLTTPVPAPLANVTQANYVNARTVLLNARTAMHNDGLATLGTGFDANWNTKPAKVTLVQQINHAVYAAMVELYGFSVQNNATNYAIAIEYRNDDGVSWEHWWVEDHGLIVETFPTMRFTLQMTNQTQVQRMSPMHQAQYTIVRIPVQSLKPEHNDAVRAGLAQYL